MVGKIEQDHLLRVVVLREHGGDSTPTVAPGFIAAVTRAALAEGYHVVLEGILHTAQYATPLLRLIRERPGPSRVYWMHVSLEETVRRHRQRAEPIPVAAAQMAGWYQELDLLGVPGEQVIAEASSFEQTVTAILHGSGLADMQALTPMPGAVPALRRETPVRYLLRTRQLTTAWFCGGCCGGDRVVEGFDRAGRVGVAGSGEDRGGGSAGEAE